MELEGAVVVELMGRCWQMMEVETGMTQCGSGNEGEEPRKLAVELNLNRELH